MLKGTELVDANSDNEFFSRMFAYSQLIKLANKSKKAGMFSKGPDKKLDTKANGKKLPIPTAGQIEMMSGFVTRSLRDSTIQAGQKTRNQ